MKRFWLVLLSLGLIVAFSTSAMAVDVKFSGEFYAAGMYLDKTTLRKDSGTDGPSTAFYFQRMRLNTTFVVHPGLFLVTRADIMERSWGAQRSDVPLVTVNDTLSAGTRAENENIAWDLAYISYISPIGIFSAGYQIDGAWGTVFGDNSYPTGKVGYMFKTGPVMLGLQTGKNNEYSKRFANTADAATVANAGAADRDSSFYTAYGIYAWKTGQVGLLFKFINNSNSRNATNLGFPFGSRTQTLSTLPYVKAQLGPVAVQAEVIWTYGKRKYEEETAATLVAFNLEDQLKISTLSAWVDATADFGMFYAGGTFAYLSGDDPSSTDKLEGGGTGGLDWNPCLIMFNADVNYWVGSQGGYNNTSNGNPMSNAYFLQARAGVRPVDKLDIMASVSWAHADKTPAGVWQSREYGYEVDLTATYKITNNLSYMLGGAYFITGDWYKGVNNVPGVDNKLTNDFMVINKLTLTF